MYRFVNLSWFPPIQSVKTDSVLIIINSLKQQPQKQRLGNSKFVVLREEVRENKNYKEKTYLKKRNKKLWIVSSAFIQIPADFLEKIRLKASGNCKTQLSFGF